MSTFHVALRESVQDPEEMHVYADKAGISAKGYHLINTGGGPYHCSTSIDGRQPCAGRLDVDVAP